ncbi:MAG: threonine--tRNA ligase [Patescibacteria group bacterium]|nr:threonine--tRNA ligase [Patescibacteria group bacterium]
MNNTNRDKQLEIETMRHSAAHVMAAAIKRLYPQAKLGIGPAIENGFYYDIEFPKPISDEELPPIEQKMEKIKEKAYPFEREEISVEEAKKLFKNNPYKLELVKDLAAESETISIYKTGEFVDLCRGPHVKDSSKIGSFKLHKIAGAYWRGNENNPMLTRIYGLSFPTKEELEQHLKMLEKAKEHDHRKIGKELNLFSFHPAAPADIFWHPKGYTIVKEMMRYWREIHEREGYVEVRTPEILTRETWDQSDHTKNFLEKMYKVTTPDAEEWNMAIKPMNCDGGMIIYNSKPRSYRDFPLRMGELGVVHRYESSGETCGILRPREFTQDDAHIYCTPSQIKKELKRVIDLCFEIYNTFGLELDHLELSTQPENSIGSQHVWKQAEEIMHEVLEEEEVPFQINEGEGAFYGPKFDFHLRDKIGRTWQCSTIQLDFAQPENFDLKYTTKEGKEKRPVMIHRVLYGSIERFLGIFIENCAGNFPVWLAPVQAIVIPVSEKQNQYAQNIAQKLRNAVKNATGRFRIEIDTNSDTLEKKIRNAELQNIPYMLIVGSREEDSGNEVSLRLRDEGDQGTVKINEFASQVQDKITKRSLEL